MHVTEFQILDFHVVIHLTINNHLNQHVHSWRLLPLHYRIYFLPRGVPRSALNSRGSSVDAKIAAEEMWHQTLQS